MIPSALSTGPRENHDWITSFLHYTSAGEAPPRLYFWVGLATIAAALRRRVWIDQAHFKWYPNLYTLLVAPPGVVAKSTTADLGFNLLRAVPGIQFGPDVATWQALLDAFQSVHEGVMYNGETLEMSCLTITASEFGNFLKPDDTAMIDQLVNIWDGKPIHKRTRMDGDQIIQNPCLNLIGCTTPSWIAQNIPEYMIGGGLTSRMIFVYAEKKEKFVAYPFLHVPVDHEKTRGMLIRDLERISQLCGAYVLTPEAIKWGTEWYEYFHSKQKNEIDETLLGGYIARKQTLAHKVAMCLVASREDELVIQAADLERAVALCTELEAEMPKVYHRIGMSEEANAGSRVIAFLMRMGGEAPYTTLYRYLYRTMPNSGEFEDLVTGLAKSGQIVIQQGPQGAVVRVKEGGAL